MSPKSILGCSGSGSAVAPSYALTTVEAPLIHNVGDRLWIIIDDNTPIIPQWPTIKIAIVNYLLPIVQAHEIHRFNILFLNSKKRLLGIETVPVVTEALGSVKPSGNTAITPKIAQTLEAYFTSLHSQSPGSPVHYLVLAENLISDDRRNLEQVLSDTARRLTRKGLGEDQVKISIVHLGWYNSLAREQFSIMRENLPRLGISNIEISLGPDSQSDGPEADGELISRMTSSLANLLSGDFRTTRIKDRVVSHLIKEACMSNLPKPKDRKEFIPVPASNIADSTLKDALESKLVTEVTLEQAVSWSANLRRIVAGKRAPTDEDLAAAIETLDTLDTVKSVLSKGVLEDSGLLSNVISFTSLEELQSGQDLSPLFWLLRKSLALISFWESKFPGLGHR